MAEDFGRDYWQTHWQQGVERVQGRSVTPNPYLDRELAELAPGTALDAGCGEGAEAAWLADHGWEVTGADISAEALARAAMHAGAADRATWVEADLGAWQPTESFDLVTTFYAHPSMPQLSFYERISSWVAPGGTVLIVGHLDAPGRAHDAHAHGEADVDGDGPPARATVTAASVTAVLDPDLWLIDTAEESDRTLLDRAGRSMTLRDVVVRATRRM